LELGRLRPRLDAELGHERAAAGEELPQGVAAAAGPRVRRDQPAVRRLVEGVQVD